MQKRARHSAIAAVISLACVQPSGAIASARLSTAGRPVRIASHAFWDSACQGQPARLQIVQQPQHGLLSARLEPITISRIDYGSSHCLGHRVPGRVVYYTPRPGFVGTDQFYYVSLKRTGEPVAHEGTVSVR